MAELSLKYSTPTNQPHSWAIDCVASEDIRSGDFCIPTVGSDPFGEFKVRKVRYGEGLRYGDFVALEDVSSGSTGRFGRIGQVGQ